jgi:hypothetical protein
VDELFDPQNNNEASEYEIADILEVIEAICI